MEIESRVKNIMSNVLGVSEDEINEESSPSNIEALASLKQMDLVISLEEEFEIEFSNEQIIQIVDYKSLVEVLKESISETI